MVADTEVPPIVEMRGITIRFPGVLALDDVDFLLRPGEIHSLMGENGAGKSTLIKALTGVYAVDSGAITVAGERRTFTSTADAQAAGISTVYQEVNLCPNLTVGENVMLGHELRRGARDRLAGHPHRGRTSPARPGHGRRPALAAVDPLDRHPAARGDQPGHGAGVQGAHPGRADLQPRPRRGRAALRRDPRAAGLRRRDPVRLPLPGPGLRDLRPDHGAAQRRPGRRVPRRRAAPGRPRDQDDRP